MLKIITAVIILFLTVLTKPVSQSWAVASTLKCSPSTGTYKVGDAFTVDYILDTQNFETFGADITATYDPGILSVTDTSSTAVTSVTNWGSPILNNIDASLGKIELQYGSSQPAYTGSTSIGKVTFSAAAAGQAQFNFTFFQQFDDTTPGVATVWGKKDGVNLSNILTDVNNCIYVVNASSAPSGNTPTPSPTVNLTASPTVTRSPTPTVTVTSLTVSELPRSGRTENSVVILLLAGMFTGIGVLLKGAYRPY